MSKLQQLHKVGQSTWLNYMRRAFIQSGELRQALDEGIEGVTANAAVFADTITYHDDYDQSILQHIRAGVAFQEIHDKLMIDDVQRAADILHPVFEASEGLNGFASLELDPSLSDEAVETVATANHILAGLDRANTMVELPATLAGCEAIRRLTANGVSLNATHLFSVSAYEQAAQAYISGLEMYLDQYSVWRIAPTAVASFSVGAIDTAVDPVLTAQGLDDWRGQTGLALARLLYARYREIFSGPRWERLARKGARPMRPKWTRLTPHDAALPDMLYIEALIGRDTVVTFTPETLRAFQEHGRVAETLPGDTAVAQAHLKRLTEADIDLDATADALQAEHLAASIAQYETLIQRIREKLYVMSGR
jgi:transaldolase